MMENQHRKIKSYRELTQEEIDMMNRIKDVETEVAKIVNEMLSDVGSDFDQRWIRVARTDIQKGFMSLVRAVAKPETEWDNV